MHGKRPPRPEAGTAGELLRAELIQEKAANLGRLARRLERALDALRAHDAAAAAGGQEPERGDERSVQRGRLLADAGEALFLYVVQREVTGLSGTAAALDALGVPREVRLRMGPRSVMARRG